MTLPKFITFTGFDAHTDVARMISLSKRYPIEWGVLFSPDRQGNGRYPPSRALAGLWAAEGLNLSAHLCGGHSRELIERGSLSDPPVGLDLFLQECKRVQINTRSAELNLSGVVAWAVPRNLSVIYQCRAAFPFDTMVDWLFDASGGRGIEPKSWPVPRSSAQERRLKGYAGGLNPDNVAAHVASIGRFDSNYWIDMESGVRDAEDRFDLDKCEAVCRAVYGDRP